MELKDAKNIFFVGIGGIGISALARLLRASGKQISGSDITESEIFLALSNEGISVTIGHRPENLPANTELLIYSSAVPEDNPERNRARQLEIAELSYPEALAQFASDKKVIAVAGTNGKTTTTAMIAWILERSGLDPSAVVGSQVLAWNSNARAGKSKYLVLEADEYRRAFLNYSADIAVITNIEPDHLDYYRDLDDIKAAFLEFARRIKLGGALVYNPLDKNCLEISKSINPGVIASPAGWRDEAIPLQVPGKFNLENAGAAAAACRVAGVSEDAIRKALESFTGTWRRFEKVGTVGKAEIYSDYAHHPAGLKVTLEMITEEYPSKKVLVVFQPHQHNRTKMLFADFVKSFCESRLNDFILAEIFEVPGREESQDQDISSQDLVRELKKCGKRAEYAKDLEECEAMVRQRLRNLLFNLPLSAKGGSASGGKGEKQRGYDMIIFMGAGDIYRVANKLVDSK